MNYRRLGNSGLRVSEISLGGWLTHGRSLSDNETNQIVHKAFDLGVITFDTADIYNKGEAELALGKALKALRREDVVVATKCFWPMSENPNDQGLSRKHITESVHGSLKRIDTDYVDLFQFHRFDPHTPIEESVAAIGDLIKQGKVLYWGVSEWTAAQIAQAHHFSRQLGVTPPVSNQPRYSIYERYIEKDILKTSEQLGMGQIVFSPLAQGLLTGKYLPGQPFPSDSRAADDKSNQFMKHLMTEAHLVEVQELVKIANKLGCTVGQLSLAWCLRQTGVSSCIVGASKISQIEENVGGSGLVVPAEIWDEIDRITTPE